MMAFSEQKRAYMGKDMQDWLTWWNIELNWPNTFPIRSVLALRAAVAEPRIWHHVCTSHARLACAAAVLIRAARSLRHALRATDRAAWVDNIDVADAAALEAVLDRAGFVGSTVLAAANAEPAKVGARDAASPLPPWGLTRTACHASTSGGTV